VSFFLGSQMAFEVCYLVPQEVVYFKLPFDDMLHMLDIVLYLIFIVLYYSLRQNIFSYLRPMK
jgi:hypothetical protein